MQSTRMEPPVNICMRKPIVRDILYPDERRAKRQLQLAFPDVDPEVVEELGFLVSTRRHTIEDAINTLTEMETAKNADAAQATGDGSKSGSGKVVKPTDGVNQKPSAPIAKDPAAKKAARNNSTPRQGVDARDSGSAGARAEKSFSGPSQQQRQQQQQQQQTRKESKDNADDVPARAVLFTTTMTGDRRVRDHCRQMETLLYLKRVQYTTINLADNPMLQRRLRDMYAESTGLSVTPSAPALFVGKHFVGNYETLQELEDDGVLMETLDRLGYREARPGGDGEDGAC